MMRRSVAHGMKMQQVMLRRLPYATNANPAAAYETRPISPHITVYRFPISAITSITHRGTGMLLGAYTGMLGCAALVNSGPELAFALEQLGNSHALTGAAIKFSVITPITFHWFGGLRHLIWDTTVKGFSVDSVVNSTYMVIGAGLLSGTILTFASSHP